MPYIQFHSHRVAWPRPETGDSVLLTFDFRSSRRGGRHHVRLEYQLPIRSENGTTSRSYSVIPLKLTHFYFIVRLKKTQSAPAPLPPRSLPCQTLRPSNHTFLVPVYFQVNDYILIVIKSQSISNYLTHTHVHISYVHVHNHILGRLTTLRMHNQFHILSVHTRAHECVTFLPSLSFFFFDHSRNECPTRTIIMLDYLITCAKSNHAI